MRVIVVLLVAAGAAQAQAPIALDWSLGPEMPAATAGGATGVLGDDLIVAGGTLWHTPDAKRYVPWTQVCDLRTRTWRVGPDLPAARAYAFSAVVDRRMYVLGGAGQDGREVANGWVLERGAEGEYEWRPGPPLPVAANWMAGGAVGSVLYCTGGAPADLSAAHNAVYAFDTADPEAGWRELPAMPGPPTTILAATTCGGDLYVFGGYRVDRALADNVDDAWRFDVSEQRWERIRDLPFAGRALSALALDDRRIVIAGPYVQSAREAAIHGQEHGHSAAVLLYDTVEDRYYPLEPMPHSVVQIGLALHQGTLYGAGGEWLYKVRSPFLFIGSIKRLH